MKVAVCIPGPGFNRTDLALTPEFLESVKVNGVLVPALVRPAGDKFEIIAGHRRWAAAKEAGLDWWPVVLMKADDRQLRELRLIENLQREDLNPADEARQYQDALDSGDYGQGKEAVKALAARVDKGVTQVYEKLHLLRACLPVVTAMAAGKLDWSSAAVLARIPDAAVQAEALGRVLDGPDYGEGPLTLRQVQEMVREDYQTALKLAPFDRERVYEGHIEGRKPTLVHAGACSSCPKRSEDGALCFDPPCYKAKCQAHAGGLLDEGEKRGQKIHGFKQAEKMFWDSGELKYGSGFVDMDKACSVTQGKTWRQALGKPSLVTELAVDTQQRVHELVPTATAMAALKAAGFNMPKREVSGGDAADRAAGAVRQKKTKAMKAAAAAAVPAILVKLVDARGPLAKVWDLLARAVFRSSSMDQDDALAKRRGLARTCNEARGGIEKWLKEEKDPAELARFVVECLLLSPGARGGPYQTPAFEPLAVEAAALAGVPLKLQSTTAKRDGKSRKGGRDAKAKK